MGKRGAADAAASKGDKKTKVAGEGPDAAQAKAEDPAVSDAHSEAGGSSIASSAQAMHTQAMAAE